MRSILLALCFLASCSDRPATLTSSSVETSEARADSSPSTSDSRLPTPDSLVAFARTLIGVPYKYASTDPAYGFDCSGFITYVHNRFGIQVPRSSVDFTNWGTEIPVAEARPGDLILFTGTNPLDSHVGHMGMIVSAGGGDTLRFIHATSGKAMGVTVTPLNAHYLERFVKVVRRQS